MFARLLDLIKHFVPASLFQNKGRESTWIYRLAIRGYLEILSQTQLLGKQKMESLQSERLKKVLLQAARIPWWKTQFERFGIRPAGTMPLDEIKKIPAKRKDDLINIPIKDLCSAFAEQQLFWRTTTGTDGMPFAWAQDIRSQFVEYAAYYLRSLEHFSFPVRENLSRRFFFMFNYPEVSGYYLTFFAQGASLRYEQKRTDLQLEDRMNLYQKINSSRPLALYGAPSALWFLGQLAEGDKVKITPDIVVFSGEMMSDDIRGYLQGIFCCSVQSFYGARELGTIGFSCQEGKSVFHLNSEHIYLEILDEQGKECQAGTLGSLTMTSLTNCAMPLLRYQLGDTGTWIKESCSCKTALPRFRLIGRESEFLILPEQRKAPVWPLYEAMFAKERFYKIRQYQIRQVGLDAILILLVRKNTWSDIDSQQLTVAIKEKIGSLFRVEIKFVDFIEKQGRKHRPFAPLNLR